MDFSPHAERALGYALDLATLAGSHLTILTAVDPFLDAASNAAGRGEALMRQTQDELQTLLVRLGDTRRMPAEAPSIAVVTGDPAEAILAQITESNADLVVMGTKGLEGAKRLVFGSTTERVLRESPVPVLAVPAPDN